MQRNGLQQYSAVGVSSAVEGASPHRLIQMLMEGALARIAAAAGHMERGEREAKGRSVSTAISIIGGLQSSLNLEAGGEVAANLDRLYDYMVRRLMEANRHDDPAGLEEVRALLRELKEGWDGIAATQQQVGAPPTGTETKVGP
jgi:flagellar protein FliS